MGRPKQITDDELIEHARAVFLELGPSASTTVVAARCGLSQAALFKRFGTKRDLLFAALRPPSRPPFLDIILEGPTDAPFEEQLMRLGTAITTHLRQWVPCFMALQQSGIPPHELWVGEAPPPIVIRASLTEYFRQAANHLGPDVDPQFLATQFMGSFHVHAVLSMLDPSSTDDDRHQRYVHAVVATLLRGVEAAR